MSSPRMLSLFITFIFYYFKYLKTDNNSYYNSDAKIVLNAILVFLSCIRQNQYVNVINKTYKKIIIIIYMSEFFINTCNQCNKNDHDEHIVFHDNGVCRDCDTLSKSEKQQSTENSLICHSCGKLLTNEKYTYSEGIFCGDCQKIITKNNDLILQDNEDDEDDEDDNDVFGEPSMHLCDACGESIDQSSEQVYSPGIFCPDCLIGMGEAYEKKVELEHRENISKIANYIPLIFEKLKEIERNTNPAWKSLQNSLNHPLQESIYESLQGSFNESLQGSFNESMQGSFNERVYHKTDESDSSSDNV